MLPQAPDPEALETLKRAATARAEELGHRLQVFRAAKQDPLCYVSFCTACRQMVLLNVTPRAADTHNAAHSSDPRQALFGYALEAPCARAAADSGRIRETAEAH
ncbi:MAG: hypothetical protein ACM3NQ_25355 [Bacteroidales bacterium]